MSIYKEVGFQPGLLASPEFQVDRISLGQLPNEFLLRPRPVLGLGRPAGPVWVSKLWFEA